jgi:hypothetical protein
MLPEGQAARPPSLSHPTHPLTHPHEHTCTDAQPTCTHTHTHTHHTHTCKDAQPTRTHTRMHSRHARIHRYTSTLVWGIAQRQSHKGQMRAATSPRHRGVHKWVYLRRRGQQRQRAMPRNVVHVKPGQAPSPTRHVSAHSKKGGPAWLTHTYMYIHAHERDTHARGLVLCVRFDWRGGERCAVRHTDHGQWRASRRGAHRRPTRPPPA